MKHRNLIISGILILGLFFMAQAGMADNSDRYARLRYVDGDVALYSSDGQRPSDATVNSPVLDGDEIETQNGRTEISFRNGIVVRIADYSAIRIESAYSPMTLELLQGTLFIDSHMVRHFGDELEVRAGNAQVYLINEGNLRVDLGSQGSVRVTTFDGEAEVRSGGSRVLLEAQERTYIDPGNAPERPEAFARNYDELDDWNQSRMDAYASNRDNRDDGNVDDSIYYDTYDLDNYGDWRTYGSYDHIWVPRTYAGWRPYYDGRWTYTNSSYFWVSSEPWGWGPYHYGRWDWCAQYGWYWIPGAVFAPAWVSWYDYGNYIGWCPLNYYNYPVYYYNGNYNNGNYGNGYPAVQKQKTIGASDSWTFVRKASLGDPSIKRISLSTSSSEIKSLRIEKDKVLNQPGKGLSNYVAGKGSKSVNSSPSHRLQGSSSTTVDSWNTGGAPVKQGWEDRGDRRSGSSGSTSKQTYGTTKQTYGSTPKSNGSTGSSSGSSVTIKKSTPPPSTSKGSSSGSSSKTKKPSPPQFQRDDQFERNLPSQNFHDDSKLSRDSWSQSNRDREFEALHESNRDNATRTREDAWKSFRESNPRSAGDENDNPWFRNPRYYEEPNGDKEVSPRYMEGAKKVFEGYEASRNSSSDRDYSNTDSSRSYTRDSRDYGSSGSKQVDTRSSSGYSGGKSYGSAPTRSAPPRSAPSRSSSSGATSAKKPH